jgi:hypothetical protein
MKFLRYRCVLCNNLIIFLSACKNQSTPCSPTPTESSTSQGTPNLKSNALLLDDGNPVLFSEVLVGVQGNNNVEQRNTIS